MAEQSSVVGVYDSMDRAEGAVRSLDKGGFPINQVSIIAQNLHSENKVHGYVTACDVSKTGATTGAWVGGLFGLLMGAAFLWVPGIGPVIVAGSLASVLLGGIEGAVAGAAMGGLMGGLAGWGISREHILKYEQVVKGGKFLVIAHGTDQDVAKAKSLLKDSGAAEVNVHGKASA